MMKRIFRSTLCLGVVAAVLPTLGCTNSVTMPQGSITQTVQMRPALVTLPLPGGSTRPTDMDPGRQLPKLDTSSGKKGQ